MTRTLSSLLLAFALLSSMSAQITQYVAPESSGTNGAVASGFLAALAAGPQFYRDLQTASPSGMPTLLSFSNGPLTTELRHRDGAGGALTGTYRNFQMTVFNTVEGPNRGVDTTTYGVSTSPDMLEITFSSPVGHFGAHAIDLESVITDPGYIRAYDSSMTMIYEAPIHYPNGEDGQNTGGNELNFLGIVSPTANISRVTIQVGNSEAEAIVSPDAENTHSLGLVDLFYGAAVGLPNRLTTTFGNDNAGSVGGAVYFDLTCTAATGVHVTGLDLNFGSTAGASGSIDVYGRAGNYGWAGPLASGTVTSAAGPGLPTHVQISPALAFGSGCHYEVAIVANGLSHRYTNGDPPVPLVYANADLTLTAGRASNVPFAEPYFSPRVANVQRFYAPGGTCPQIAGVEKQGEGFAVQASSIYELTTPAAFDLANSGLLFAVVPDDDRIAVVHDPAAALQPFASTAIHLLPMLDDNAVAVGTLGFTLPVVVGSNGWIAAAIGNSTTFAPSVATMLANPERAFYSWKDLNPTAVGSGKVYYEESFFGPLARALVSFAGVYGFGTTQPNTLQFVCDFVHVGTTYELLQVEIVWGAMAGDGSDVLVGYSPGGASADPGPRDLSAIATPVQSDPADVHLELVPVGRPVQGPGNVPFEVTLTNVPPSALLHMGLVGLINPSYPLALFDMPACSLYSTLDSLIGPVLLFGGDVTWSPLVLPALPASFAGFEFYVQSVLLGTPQNHAFGFGAVTSNGLKCTVGSL